MMSATAVCLAAAGMLVMLSVGFLIAGIASGLYMCFSRLTRSSVSFFPQAASSHAPNNSLLSNSSLNDDGAQAEIEPSYQDRPTYS